MLIRICVYLKDCNAMTVLYFGKTLINPEKKQLANSEGSDDVTYTGLLGSSKTASTQPGSVFVWVWVTHASTGFPEHTVCQHMKNNKMGTIDTWYLKKPGHLISYFLTKGHNLQLCTFLWFDFWVLIIFDNYPQEGIEHVLEMLFYYSRLQSMLLVLHDSNVESEVVEVR